MNTDNYTSETIQTGRQAARRWRPQFTLGAVFSMVTVAALLVVLNLQSLRDAFGVKEPELLRPINTASDLEEALKAPRAVVFIQVRWSLTSMVVRRSLEEMIRTWRDDRDTPPVSFYVLDVTKDYRKKPQRIQQWLTSHPALKRATNTGAGEVIWLRDGEMLQCTPNVVRPERLLEIGRATFDE
jgi:hypothetical protein